MGKVNLMTQAQYARHRGCSKVAVGKAVKAGRISLVNGLIDATVADIQWKANTRARVSTVSQPQLALDGEGSTRLHTVETPTEPEVKDDGYRENRTRREMAEANMAELKEAQMRKEILSRDEATRAAFEIGRQVRDALSSSRRSLSPYLAATSSVTDCEEILRKEHQQILENLAKTMSRLIPTGTLPA